MALEELKTGESAVIDVVGGEGELRQHFLDMGVIPGAEVTLIKLARGKAQGNYQYCGRHKYREKPLPDHATDGAGYPHGTGP